MMVTMAKIFTIHKQCNKEKTYLRVKVFDTLNVFRNETISILRRWLCNYFPV